ncbi:MAG: DUF433 domain-containing protein [Pseudolabrys sp.]
MGGKPCVRGLRVTVGMIVGQIGAGLSVEDLLAEYPYLETRGTFLRRCGMRLGVRRNGRSNSPATNEFSGRHESLAKLGRLSDRRWFHRGSLVR